MTNENLHVYVRAFGKDISFTLANGTALNKDNEGQPLKGIFDNAYFLQEIGDMDLSNTQPRLTCVEADVTNVKKEDTVSIDGILYDVTEKPQPDGTGMCALVLCKHGKL
jgi:hypothetical protein